MAYVFQMDFKLTITKFKTMRNYHARNARQSYNIFRINLVEKNR